MPSFGGREGEKRGESVARSVAIWRGLPALKEREQAKRKKKKKKKKEEKKKKIHHQLTSGDLDTLGLEVLRVAGRHGAPLAELLELVDLYGEWRGGWRVREEGAAGKRRRVR